MTPIVRLAPAKPKSKPSPRGLPAVQPAVPVRPDALTRLRKVLSRIETPLARKILTPVAVAVLGLVLLGFVASRPVPAGVESVLLTLQEGESRMATVPFDPGAPPVELKGGEAEVADTSIFLLQEGEGLLHVLVTGVAAGDTTWAVVTADGRTRAFRTQVRPRPLRPVDGDPLRLVEEADALLAEVPRELSNAHKAVERYREACAILGAAPYGKVDPRHRAAAEKLERAEKAWRELVANGESELALAKMNGDGRAIRQALANLLAIAPDERSIEHQKNSTLLNYVYGRKRKARAAEEAE